MIGFNRRRKVSFIKRIFGTGEETLIGGYYPLLPGINLWQDLAKTIPAYEGDPVRVVAKVAGTFNDADAVTDNSRPILVKRPDGSFALDMTGNKTMRIDDATIDGETSVVLRASSKPQEGSVDATLFCMEYINEETENIQQTWLCHNITNNTEIVHRFENGVASIANTDFSGTNIFSLVHDWTNDVIYFRLNKNPLIEQIINFLLEEIVVFSNETIAFGCKYSPQTSSFSNHYKGYIGGFCVVKNNDLSKIRMIENGV